MLEVQASSNSDIVKGNRYIEGGGVYGWPLRRKLTSRVAGFVAETILGSEFTDLTGSFRLYRRKVFEAVIQQVVSPGYMFQIEILIRAQLMGCKIAEIPITFVDRQYGESKLGAGEIAGFLKGLWLLLQAPLLYKEPASSC